MAKAPTLLRPIVAWRRVAHLSPLAHLLAVLLISLGIAGCTRAISPDATPTQGGKGWEEQRVLAVVSLYRITEEGKEALLGLDVRQMRGEPGFFGSYGYKGWTGLGEAKPIQVIHELSHAYWGAFPISGSSQLSWDAPPGRVSAAMQRYHSDVLAFMGQPPDHYEPLRERLRNLPELSSENLNPLFHTVEADLVYTVAGDLELVPPILRKYWDKFLQPGPFYNWYDAAAWYQAISDDERHLANKYLGIEHFDFDKYRDLHPSKPFQADLGVEKVLSEEDEQRLGDFVEQFDLLLGSPEYEEDFKFWRRYLRDKLELYKRYPRFLRKLPDPEASQIAQALNFLQTLDNQSSEEKARLVGRQLKSESFVVHFLPVLNNRTLLELFTSGELLPPGGTLKGTADFVERLKRFSLPADTVLDRGRLSAEAGAEELTRFLEGRDFNKEKEDLKFFFDLLADSDKDTAKMVIAALENPLLRRLLKLTPAHLRLLLKPSRLLEVLDITATETKQDVVSGIGDLIGNPSGNFRIDKPFREELYKVMAERARRDPLDTLHIIRDSPFPLGDFIRLYPKDAVIVLSSDLAVATELVKTSDPVLLPPARLVYLLIYADPEFAARLVGSLASEGEGELVVEILAHIAYDAPRLDAVPSLPISLAKDGRFLERLLDERGAAWLEAQMGRVVEVYMGRIAEGEAPSDFLEAYRATLFGAVATLEDEGNRNRLRGVIEAVMRTR